jgi:hypothetical protein
MSAKTRSRRERAEGVSRKLKGKDASKQTNPEGLVGPTGSRLPQRRVDARITYGRTTWSGPPGSHGTINANCCKEKTLEERP